MRSAERHLLKSDAPPSSSTTTTSQPPKGIPFSINKVSTESGRINHIGKGLATFSVLLQMEKRIDIPHLPLAQVQRLFKLSQELRDLSPEAA